MGASGKLLFISAGLLVFISSLISYFLTSMGIVIIGFTKLSISVDNVASSIPIIGQASQLTGYIANFIAVLTYQIPPELLPPELNVFILILEIGVVVGIVGVFMP